MPAAPAPPDSKDVVDALRLPPPALVMLHERLDREARGGNASEAAKRRKWKRWIIHGATAHATLSHPGGTSATFLVAPRTLSGGGMSMLHGGFVHQGSEVRVLLPNRDGDPCEVRGEVVRCRHIGKHVHELGVKFETPINPRDFLDLGFAEEALVFENVDPRSLEGRMMLVFDEGPDREMIVLMLRNTRVEVDLQSDAPTAVDSAGAAYDVILVDQTMAWVSGLQLASRVRAAKVDTPILMATATEPHLIESAAREAGVSALLAKPLTERQLHCALAEFLTPQFGSVGGSQRVIASTLNAGPGGLALVERFVEESRTLAGQIDFCLRNGDAVRIAKIVNRLRTSGATYGFEPLTIAAQSAESSLAERGLAGASAELRRLRDLCRRCVAR
jgi:CheY-like chemotaxis protein